MAALPSSAENYYQALTIAICSIYSFDCNVEWIKRLSYAQITQSILSLTDSAGKLLCCIFIKVQQL